MYTAKQAFKVVKASKGYRIAFNGKSSRLADFLFSGTQQSKDANDWLTYHNNNYCSPTETKSGLQRHIDKLYDGIEQSLAIINENVCKA